MKGTEENFSLLLKEGVLLTLCAAGPRSVRQCEGMNGRRTGPPALLLRDGVAPPHTLGKSFTVCSKLTAFPQIYVFPESMNVALFGNMITPM